MEINGAVAVRRGAGADLVLSVLLSSFVPLVAKDGQTTKVHLIHGSLPCVPVHGLTSWAETPYF